MTATPQLGLVSLLIGAIVGSFALSALFVVVTVVVAARTAGRRMTGSRRRRVAGKRTLDELVARRGEVEAAASRRASAP